MPEGEFSVWVYLPDGYHFPVARYIDAALAVRMAKRACDAPGPAERVIITDGGDECCFEWRRGEGMTFPPRAEEQ